MIRSARDAGSSLRLLVVAMVVAACSQAAAPGPEPALTVLEPASSTVAPSSTLAPVTSTPPPSTTTTLPPATTTTTLPEVLVHVFPLDPPEVGDYAPGGHSYQATDIFAPVGTRFVAVTSGVIQGVSRTDRWDPAMNDGATRGGLFVSLIGDDGFRYYGSHLSAVADGIEAGVPVAAGQLLGLVGVSGSARDTPPHLHFGISRPTELSDWEVRRGELDPVPLLDAWRAGDTSATPQL